MKKISFTLITCCWALYLQSTEPKELEAAILLHSKVYCTAPLKRFDISESENPYHFRPFERDINQKFSWTFKPTKNVQNNKCFILVGYADQDTDDAQAAAVNLLNNPLFLGTAAPAVSPAQPNVPSSPAQPNPPTPENKPHNEKGPAKPQSTGQVSASAQPSTPPIPQPANPVVPQPTKSHPTVLGAQDAMKANLASSIILTPQDAARAKQKPGGPLILTAQDIKKPRKKKPRINVPEVQGRPLVLDFMVACSNDPKINITDEDADDILQDSKVYGDAFNLIRYKNCRIIAKKYKEDASPDEIKEAMEQLYFAIKEPSRLFE